MSKAQKRAIKSQRAIKKFMPTVDPSHKECSGCHKYVPSVSKCSHCGCAEYCSRECQISNWTLHKPVCHQIFADKYPDDAIRNLQLVNFAFAMHGRFENFGRRKGFIRITLTREKCSVPMIGYYYCGEITFIPEESDNMEPGTNLIEITYNIDGKDHTRCIHVGHQTCSDCHDNYKSEGYRIYAIQANQKVPFICGGRNYFDIDVDGIHTGKQ